MPTPSASSTSLFFRSHSTLKGRGRDGERGTLRRARPPPLDSATFVRSNSGLIAAALHEGGGALGLSDFLTEDRNLAEGCLGGGQQEPTSPGSGGLLGSFHQVGMWGENVTRSLLDAVGQALLWWENGGEGGERADPCLPPFPPSSKASHRSQSPASGPPTPRASSTFAQNSTQLPSSSYSRTSTSSTSSLLAPNTTLSPSSSSSSFPSAFSSPSQTTPDLTPTNSSSSSPFNSFTPLASFPSHSSLNSALSFPLTPPSGPDAHLDPLRELYDTNETEKKPKDVLGKLWRKGPGSVLGRRSTDPGGANCGGAPPRDEDDEPTVRARKSRPSLGGARVISGLSSRAGGMGLSRRLSRNFGGGGSEATSSEFGSFIRRSSASSRKSTSSPLDVESTSQGEKPTSPSDPSFLAIPRPPPFFYGGGTENDATKTSTLVLRDEGPVVRVGPKFVRSSSVSSSASGTSGESWGAGTNEDSLEHAEIGFGEWGRREWAGSLQSPDATTMERGFFPRDEDRSSIDISPTWLEPQARESPPSFHRSFSSLSATRDRQSFSYIIPPRTHSRSFSLSPNFTIRGSPALSPDPPAQDDASMQLFSPPLLATPPRPSPSSSIASFSHLPPTSHAINISSANFRQARDRPRPRPSLGPSQTSDIIIKIIEATPAKTRASTKVEPDSPDSDVSTRLSPPRTGEGGPTEEEVQEWTSAKILFGDSLARRTSLDSQLSEADSSLSVDLPRLSGSGAYSTLLLEPSRRRKDTPSVLSLTQSVLSRYYEPSIREREASGGSTGTDESYVSAEDGSATILETLISELERPWSDRSDEEEEDHGKAQDEARRWMWAVPPLRKIWVEVDGEAGLEVQKSAVVEDDLKFFPLDRPPPARHVYICHRSPTSTPATMPECWPNLVLLKSEGTPLSSPSP